MLDCQAIREYINNTYLIVWQMIYRKKKTQVLNTSYFLVWPVSLVKGDNPPIHSGPPNKTVTGSAAAHCSLPAFYLLQGHDWSIHRPARTRYSPRWILSWEIPVETHSKRGFFFPSVYVISTGDHILIFPVLLLLRPVERADITGCNVTRLV